MGHETTLLLQVGMAPSRAVDAEDTWHEKNIRVGMGRFCLLVSQVLREAFIQREAGQKNSLPKFRKKDHPNVASIRPQCPKAQLESALQKARSASGFGSIDQPRWARLSTWSPGRRPSGARRRRRGPGLTGLPGTG